MSLPFSLDFRRYNSGICIYANICDYQGTVCRTRKKKARKEEKRNMKQK